MAAHKADSLLAAGAAVQVISPRVCERLGKLGRARRLGISRRAYRGEDMLGAVLVFACSDDRQLQARVLSDARRAGVLAAAADDASASDFISGSVLRRGDLCLVVSTSGKSPSLAVFLRRELEERIGPVYAEIVSYLGRLRESMKADGLSGLERKRLFDEVLGRGLLGLLESGRHEEAETLVREFVGAKIVGKMDLSSRKE